MPDGRFSKASGQASVGELVMNLNLRFVLGIGLSALFWLMVPTAANADVISNGNFATGDLSGWTAFTTANGTNGSGLPDVVSFDTTGSGASNSAQFDVGAVNFDGTQQGGGLSQIIDVTSAGVYTYSAAIASQDDASGQVNTDAGTFSILINGVSQDSVALGGFSLPGQILRGTLSGSVDLPVGFDIFSIEITRAFLSDLTASPEEYVTNISLTTPASGPQPAPEPSSVILLSIVLLAVAIMARKRIAQAF
jgi:hypothetical protein